MKGATMKTTENTESTIRVLLSTLPPTARERILQECIPSPIVECKIIRRPEAARLLARSTRAVDYLVAAGVLPKVTFPGRQKAAGFRLSDVQALIGGR